MAQVPSQEQVTLAQLATDTEINEKLSDQQAQGKDFKLPEGGSSGVMPEDTWKEHKGE